MEAIVKDKIMFYLQSNDLSPHQHGFQPARSCTSQLLEVLDSWTQAIEEGKPVDAIYLDISKAFYSVPHARLLTKIQVHGIEGMVLQWLMAFLAD